MAMQWDHNIQFARSKIDNDTQLPGAWGAVLKVWGRDGRGFPGAEGARRTPGPVLRPVPSSLRVQFPHLSTGGNKPLPAPYMPSSLEDIWEMAIEPLLARKEIAS